MIQFKSLFTTALLLSATIVVHAQTHKKMEKVQFNEDQQAVLNAVEKMTAAFHNKDIEGVMKSYEKNALVVFEPETPVSDPKVLREMFMNAFMINPHFTYSGHEVFVNGDIATHFAPWLMTGQAPDGTKIQQSGLSVAVLRKQQNGEWLMVFDDPHGQHLMNK